MSSNTVSMDPKRFATAAVNLLHAAFLGASRAQAKRHFARVHGGAVLDLAVMSMEDGSQVQFRAALDHGEFRGRFGFPVFRQALDQLLARLAERIRAKKQDMNIYTSENGALLFNVPSLLQAEGQLNVLMLGVDAPEQGAVTLRLQFLDPSQFERSQEVRNSP